MIRDGSFERIRDEIAGDLTPVTPIRPAWQAGLVVIPLGLFALSVVLLAFGLRDDAAVIGPWPLWGPTGLLVGAAYVLLVLALVQRAPESTTSWVWWALLPLAAIGLQIGGAYWTLQFQNAGSRIAAGWATDAACFFGVSLLSAPTLLLGLWLLARGFPLRSRIAGLLAGLAGGILSDAMYRLHCSLSRPSHVVPWHTGAILVMGLFGLLAGLWWERRRERNMGTP